MEFEDQTFKLNYIRDSIENMEKSNHIEILKLLSKYSDVVINSNKSGSRVNLSNLQPNIIEELLQYVQYIKNQEQTLNIIDKQMIDYKNIYFQTENE
jgi:replicative superfamily II helicase